MKVTGSQERNLVVPFCCKYGPEPRGLSLDSPPPRNPNTPPKTSIRKHLVRGKHGEAIAAGTLRDGGVCKSCAGALGRLKAIGFEVRRLINAFRVSGLVLDAGPGSVLV